MMALTDTMHLLQQIDLFRALDAMELRQVAAVAQTKRFMPGQLIFVQEDEGDCLYVIASGHVRIFLMNPHPDGREVTLRVYGPRAAFGEFAVLDSLARSASASAIDEVTAVVIYRDDFLSLMEQHFALVRRVIAVLLERLRYTTTFSQNLAFLSASQRIAAALIQLADHTDAASPTRELHITQVELGQHANTTREWVSKSLRLFETEGLIQKGQGGLTVLDLDRLRHWAKP